MKRNISVLIASNLRIAEAISAILRNDPKVTSKAIECDADEVYQHLAKGGLDILILDLSFAGGLRLIKKIMAFCPLPILTIGDDNDEKLAAKAISSGALDFIPIKNIEIAELFLHRLHLLADCKVIRHVAGWKDKDEKTGDEECRVKQSDFLIVGIGASIGGPGAIESILRELPEDFWGTVLIVQHIGEFFFESFVERLALCTKLRVDVALANQRTHPGHVHIAPPHFHLQVTRQGNLQLESGPLVCESKPSIDQLFLSMTHIPHRSLGVILTGMGTDGARGLLELKKAGGRTIAQDEYSSVVFGMPGEAIRLGAVEEILPLAKIPQKICSFARQYSRESIENKL